MLVVGLGNPGSKYENTVHNTGFSVINLVLDKLGLKLKESGCQAKYVTTFVAGDKVVIAEPQTFMNLSGESVKQLMNANKFTPSDLVVVYDDIDLPLGSLRIRKEGSAGTHNGMRNIIDEIATTQFTRIRVGMNTDRGQMELKDYVLSHLSGENREKMDIALSKASECVLELINTKKLEDVMQKYNGNMLK